MPDSLPPTALRINYEYKRDVVKAVWKEIRKEEKVIPKEFEKRSKNLLQVCLRYLNSFPGILAAYWQRQLDFYRSVMPRISLRGEEKQQTLNLSGKGADLKKDLVIQFELYKELLCSSPEVTAELIAQKLSKNPDLTAELAGELILAVFVGRDISYCLPGGSPKLLPITEKYISYLGQICHSLHQVLHPAPPINGLRRHSAPGLSVFQEQPPIKTNLITMQLTPEEAQLIAEFRKKELTSKEFKLR